MTPSQEFPSNPSLRQLRNQAKDLHKAQKAGDPNALQRIQESHPRFSGLSLAEIAAAEVSLADAQLVIARELGFSSWPKLKSHIESLSSPSLRTNESVTDDKVKEALVQIEKLGGRCEVGVEAPIGWGQQRRYLVHDLVSHLLAHLAGYLEPASIQVERLAHGNVKVGAAKALQVVPEELPTVVDHRQQRHPAAQCQEYDPRPPRL